MFQKITHRSIVRVLIAGFSLVILLLLTAGFIAVRNAGSIKESAAHLVEEQLVATQLIDEIQREQATLSAVLYHLEVGADRNERDQLLRQLDAAAEHIDGAVVLVPHNSEVALWDAFHDASKAFLEEARRALERGTLSESSSRNLFGRHEEVVSTVARLSAASVEKATVAQMQIDRRAQDLVNKSFFLLGVALALALVCVVLTVRTVTALFRRMEWQANELSRVSWHMVENQETSARRFSHELHDELGQALTAIKANLASIDLDSQHVQKERLRDCVHLADAAIENVRELSQLLHPVILDDFGLDAGLRWLCDGFAARTGIDAEYSSTFTGRLPEETETHLFRIAQEALTNVARHSGAGQVSVTLHTEESLARLWIQDNGRGLPETGDPASHGIGLIGMRARARSAGGELTMKSAPDQGVRIEVEIPLVSVHHEEGNTHPVGR